MRARWTSFAPVAFSMAACGGATARAPDPATPSPIEADAGAPSAAAAQAPAVRADGHLPQTAVPLGYSLSLRIDPAQPRFSGTTTIVVQVRDPTQSVVLNATGMNITHAIATVGATEIPASWLPRRAHTANADDEVVLSFRQPLPAGTATLAVTYDAPFAADLLGLYRVEEKGRWYAYTQFEPTHARRAFPCFDEPEFKTPYNVRITVPRGSIALSNTPELAHADDADAMVVYDFQPSPPLPSYLVAFAVGDFDFAAGQTEPFPIRVVTTKGRASLAISALDDAAALAERLGEYFDLRYPYAKLDLVAVPDFAAGAMENPGLITFRDSLLLVERDRVTTALKRSQAAVIAHELAHQWFGDLVTMRWWDDIWLNEGFATWAQAKVVDEWKPGFGATLEQIAGVQGVMDLDALASARAVRQPVRSTGEAAEAFDGLTYDKGAAVLRMLEAWLGADTFRRGIQRYIHQNAWKNANADDLFEALDYVSTQKVGKLASAFLDEPGVPQVLARWSCNASGEGRIDLRQSEWRPLGEPRRDPARSWTLPACVAKGGDKTASCFTLGADPIVRSLGPGCPAWVFPNAEQAGYYRFLVDPPQLAALVGARRSLGVAERVGLISNVWAGVRQGAIAPGALLDMLAAFDGETNRLVLDQIVGVLGGIEQALVDGPDVPAFRRYVSARLAQRKHALGWSKASGADEDDDRALERRSILWTLGVLAGDEATLREAEAYARAWLKDPRSISADVAAIAVPLASMNAGESRLGELRSAARTANVPQDRIIAVGAMGMFDDPAVLREALDLTLTDELRLSELRYVFGSAQNRRATRGLTYAWIKENWSRLRARLPPTALRGFSGIAGAVCTPAQRDDARAFLRAAMQGLDGAKRGLDEALERADLCVALHQYGSAEVSRYLGRF
ncbi:MAG TPA: M1 family metallopeptidase [Polyangiaceae bacterium]|nr:M1 family metallopeptidase [Polyangiaceae bacterium]